LPSPVFPTGAGIISSCGSLHKLHSISPDEISKTWGKDQQVHFDAIVDGWIIPEQPAKIFEQGRELHIPILIGSNADEATVFGHGGPRTIEEYKKYLLQDTGNFAELEFQAYRVSSDTEVPVRYLQLQSDTFAYGAYSMAQSITNTGQKAYL
jgi:para-nitrobenzyl esterase